MPWNEATVMDQRIRFVVLAVGKTASMTRLCQEFGISRPTGYLWLARYQQGGFAALEDRSHRPATSPMQTPAALEAQVLALRQTYGWGGKKLALMLPGDVSLSVPTVNRILKRNGCIPPAHRDHPAVTRFERAEPNQLWQMDFKGQFPMRQGWCYPLSVLDDHSRFALELVALPSTHLDGMWPHLEAAFRTYGLPDAMLMDHGEPWWGSTNTYGLTALVVRLLKQGITLLHGAVAHPQTQGKVERFHRTLDEAMRRQRPLPDHLPEWAQRFAEFRTIYNTVRPHEALGMATPATFYQASSRPYVEHPPAWVYPADITVRTVDRLGMLSHQGHRYFISEALVGEGVGVEAVGEVLLVRYRNWYIREINTTNHRSTSLSCSITVPQKAPV
jgi:transposase InsO family protein